MKIRMADLKRPEGFREVRCYERFTWSLRDDSAIIKWPVAIISDVHHGGSVQVMDVRSGQRIVSFVYTGGWNSGWPIDKVALRSDAYHALSRLQDRYSDASILRTLWNVDALPEIAS